MIIVLLGGTCSGKTEFALRCQKYGFNKVITNTTRERRKDDSENAYHFLTKEEFFDKVKNGEMIEFAEYNGNYYGTSVDSLSKNCVIVLEPNGFRALKEKMGENVFSIYLDVPDEVRLQRGLLRGDKEEVLRQRIIGDKKLFEGFNDKTCNLVLRNITFENMNSIIESSLNYLLS